MSTPAGADEPLAPLRLSDGLEFGWEFFKGPLGGPWEVWHSNELAVFEKVAMPHCFNAMDGCDPEVPYYRGPGWYRTWIQPKNPYANGRTLLHFWGAGQVTTVLLGNEKLIEHKGGYDEFVVDLTDALAKVTADKRVCRSRCCAITRAAWIRFRRTSRTSRCTADCTGMWSWCTCPRLRLKRCISR